MLAYMPLISCPEVIFQVFAKVELLKSSRFLCRYELWDWSDLVVAYERIVENRHGQARYGARVGQHSVLRTFVLAIGHDLEKVANVHDENTRRGRRIQPRLAVLHLQPAGPLPQDHCDHACVGVGLQAHG